MSYKFDVALSFAGEQRADVERVADCLKAAGLKVFFDTDEKRIFGEKTSMSTLVTCTKMKQSTAFSLRQKNTPIRIGQLMNAKMLKLVLCVRRAMNTSFRFVSMTPTSPESRLQLAI